jgi:hypothetical protein
MESVEKNMESFEAKEKIEQFECNLNILKKDIEKCV